MASQLSVDELETYCKESNLSHCFSSKQILEKCVALGNRFPQSIADLMGRVEAFLLNNDAKCLTLELMGKFESFLYNDFQKTTSTPDSSMAGKRPAPMSNQSTGRKSVRTETPSGAAGGDSVARSLETSFAHASGVAYSDRTNRGSVVLSYETPSRLGSRAGFSPSSQRPLGQRVVISQNDADCENIRHRYRYMFTTLKERASALDEHLQHLQTALCLRAHIPESQLSPVGRPSQDVAWICGRIVCETAQGRLNKASIWLEGNRRDSNGRRTQLNLTDVPEFSLFPGQVVLVEGVDASGKKMAVRRIMDACAPTIPRTPVSSLRRFHYDRMLQGGGAVRMMVASGPFTSSDDLNYQPLMDLLREALNVKPDVLVLLGPFVDVSQPLLATGDVKLADDADDPSQGEHGASYEMVFVERVMRDGLQAFFNAENDDEVGGNREGLIPTQIILIPSLQDGHHEMVFPQPPMGDRDIVHTPYFEEPLGKLDVPFARPEDPKRRVHLLPNPCTFRVNDVVIGACSSDILFALSSDEISQGLQGNRLCRLAGHLIGQRSFVPQFPIPPSSFSAQLDMRQAKHWRMKQCPDVLLLPSRLAPLVKEVAAPSVDVLSDKGGHTEAVQTMANVLVVNPGQLVKGRAGGSYADISIHPIPEADLAKAYPNDSALLAHNVPARTFAQIIKI